MQRFAVPHNAAGALSVMPQPGPAEQLDRAMTQLADAGVDAVVSLLTDVEVELLGLKEEPLLAQARALRFRRFPIPDGSVPSDLEAFCALATDIAQWLADGQSVTIHCWGGIGRSGMLASSVLVLLGHAPDTVFEHVSAARGIRVPETREQAAWLTHTVLPRLASRARQKGM